MFSSRFCSDKSVVLAVNGTKYGDSLSITNNSCQLITPERQFVLRTHRATRFRQCGVATATSKMKIVVDDILTLLDRYAKKQYSNKKLCDELVSRASELMRKDNVVIELPNKKGELSFYYPRRLLIPVQETSRHSVSDVKFESASSSSDPDSDNDGQIFVNGKISAKRLRKLMKEARAARCRTRFPLPVILYKGKYICRSATLSSVIEMYTRKSMEYFATQSDGSDDGESPVLSEDEQNLLDSNRRNDMVLLKALNVTTIIDLMVENKKVKYGIRVSSSEKVDKEERYKSFLILSLPYPGCEFFRNFRDNDYSGYGLVFDWSQPYVDAQLQVPTNLITAELDIEWHMYKKWDLIEMTQNYLLLLLKYVQTQDTGILVHCISGWDRTPLFISLLRISLWADGEIHQTLSTLEMLYFTLAYDWVLFGHHLPNRLDKGEVIFYFCFYMLKYIQDEEFVVRNKNSDCGSTSSIEVLRTDSEMMPGGDNPGSSISLNSISSFASRTSSSRHDTQTYISSGIGLTGNGASSSVAITGRNNGASRYDGATDGELAEIESLNSFNGNNSGSSSSIGFVSEDSSNHNIQSSPQSKKTSPVTVPSRRQRQESTSSHYSVGSWQMVSSVGSYRIDDSASEMAKNHPQQSQSGNSPQQPSASTLNANQATGRESGRSNHKSLRNQRLDEMRILFCNCYGRTISLDYNPGVESTFSGLWGNLAQKVFY